MNWLAASVIILSTANFNALAPKDDDLLSAVIKNHSNPLKLINENDWRFGINEMPEVMIISPDAPVELYSRFASIEKDPCLSGFTLKGFSLTDEDTKTKKTKPKKRRIVMVASPSCPPCNQFKSYQVPKLKAAGWNVGNDEKNHLQIVTPGVYPAAVWPTFIYMENGKEVRRHEGYATMNDIEWLLSGDRNSSM